MNILKNQKDPSREIRREKTQGKEIMKSAASKKQNLSKRKNKKIIHEF